MVVFVFIIEKMAENKRKKRLIVFSRDFKQQLNRDLALKTLVTKIQNGDRLWRQMTDGSDSETDFDGFGDSGTTGDDRNETTKETTEVTTEETTEETTNVPVETALPVDSGDEEVVNNKMADKIQQLLRSQWEERVRQWGRQTDDRKDDKSDDRRTTIGKSILRKARLEINKNTLERIRSAQTLMDTSRPPKTRKELVSKSGQPGFITCAICGQTKYYSHVQRRYGVFSCEPCSKFFARFMKEPKQYFCAESGDCPINESNVSRVSTNRCKGCWIKVCLQKFSLEEKQRNFISNNFWPKLETPPNVALITVDTSNVSTNVSINDVTRSSLLMVAAERGPRVKRVCRSAGVVNGLPKARFGDSSDSDSLPMDIYLCQKKNKKKKKKIRCKSCSGCKAEDCGNCAFCRDKKKFGGQNVIKQACRYRTCTNKSASIL